MNTEELMALLRQEDPAGAKEINIENGVGEWLEIRGVTVFADEINIVCHDAFGRLSDKS